MKDNKIETEEDAYWREIFSVAGLIALIIALFITFIIATPFFNALGYF